MKELHFVNGAQPSLLVVPPSGDIKSAQVSGLQDGLKAHGK